MTSVCACASRQKAPPWLRVSNDPWEPAAGSPQPSAALRRTHVDSCQATALAAHLLMFCEAGFVVDVRRDQVELVLLSQQPQQDDHCPAAALPHAIVNHLAGERQHLQTQPTTLAGESSEGTA